MAKHKGAAARLDPLDFEQACETWDWARTAGVSARQLHDALRQSLLQDTGFRLAA